MRLLRLSTLLLILSACGHTCPVADAARPARTAHFVAMAASSTASQILLLGTRAAGDGGTAMTVEPIHDFTSVTGTASTANVWLDQRSRWQDALGRDMRGTGIGLLPVLPPALPNGAFVTIGGATSVVHFPLVAQDYSASDDAGVITGDAGVLPPEQAHLWEYVWPTVMLPAVIADVDAGPRSSWTPQVADLVVIPQNAPDPDIAVVSRTVVMPGGVMGGGETFVLNIDDPAHVVSLATITLDSYADMGLHAAAAGFAYQDHVLYAAIDHEDFAQMNPTYGPGLVAIVDPSMRSIRTVLRIPNLTNCTQIAPFIRPSDSTEPATLRRMIVTCAGTEPATIGTPPSDGGFVYIQYDTAHPDRLPSIERTITATSLALPRADGGTIPLYGHWLAFVSHGSSAPAFSDRLIVANLDTNASQVLDSAPAANGVAIYGLGRGAFDPSTGVLVVPNGFDGVLTWWFPSDAHTFEATSYVFPDSNAVPIVDCGHVAVQTVRLVGGGTAEIVPMGDAGVTPDDAGVTPTDMGMSADDAGNDAAVVSDPDAGVDAG